MIPVQFGWPVGSYYFEQPWSLDGVTYLLTLRFNLRINTWFLDVADIQGTVIVAGIALLTNRDLLKQYSTLALPQGLMFVYDSTGVGTNPGKDDFSLTHRLLYLSNAA